MELESYQKQAVMFLLERPNVGLALPMGAGKTVIALTAMDILLSLGEVRRALIVMPKAVLELRSWQRQIEQWPHLSGRRVSWVEGDEKNRLEALKSAGDVVAISQDNFPWLARKIGRRWPFDLVILDDVKGIKHRGSARWRAIRALRDRISRLWILSGTFAANSVEHLWPTTYLLDRGERLFKTLGAFREAFMEPDKRNGPIVYSWRPRPGARDRIFERIRDIYFTVDSVPEIELVMRTIPVALPDAALHVYLDMERYMIVDEQLVASNAGVLAGKLLQIASGAVYEAHGAVREIHAAKVDRLMEMVEMADEPILVAYWFKHERDRLLAAIKGAVEFSPQLIKPWQDGKIPVMLIHPASAGHGIDGLQQGSGCLVWYSLTWDLEIYRQTNARLARRGAKRGVVVVNHLVAEGTVDSRVMRVLEDRAADQAALFEAIKKAPCLAA